MQMLPSELCAVINEDRNLEGLRNRIGWIYDYRVGNTEYRPWFMSEDAENNYQEAYKDLTGCYWSPVTGSNITKGVDWK